MAKTDERILEMVERELSENPDVKTSDVYEKAKSAVPSIAELTIRQFQGRYFLRVKNRIRREAEASSSAGAASARKSAAKPRRRSAAKKPARKTPAARAGRKPKARAAKPEAAAPRGEGVTRREGFRRILIEFSRDVAAAEDNRALLDVVSRMDSYVDRLEELS